MISRKNVEKKLSKFYSRLVRQRLCSISNREIERWFSCFLSLFFSFFFSHVERKRVREKVSSRFTHSNRSDISIPRSWDLAAPRGGGGWARQTGV